MKNAMRPLSAISLALLLILSALIYLDSRLTFPFLHQTPTLEKTSLPSSLPSCPHALLLTAPRHGSTWLVDSIEHCKFRQNGTFSNANAESEIWIPGKPILANITVDEAFQRLNFSSTKLFPRTFNRGTNASNLIRLANEAHIPIFVLSRAPKDSYRSWRKAIERDVWNRVSNGVREAEVEGEVENLEEDEEFLEYRNRLNGVFERMRQVLHDVGVKAYDWFEYDEIVGREFIVAENSSCYIHNCNYIAE